jgi:hypothetical protein
MRLLTTILFLAAAGCVGDIGDEDPGNGSGSGSGSGSGDTRAAKEIFKADVHVAVNRCAGPACHNVDATATAAKSKFYSPDAEASYQATVKAPNLIGSPEFSSIAPILTYVQAGHQGLSYTPDQTAQITAWLAAETKERTPTGGGSNQPPPFDVKAALKEWSGCMSLENFQASNMTQAWSTLAADNLQKCLNCHNGGVAGFLISANAQQFFTGLSTQAAYLIKYFSVDVAARKVVVGTGAFDSANKIVGHPTFPIENAGMVALKKFYDLTVARKEANQCDPPRLVD